MASVPGWLRNPFGRAAPRAVGLVPVGQDALGGTWSGGSSGYIEIAGEFEVRNESSHLIEVVQVDLRRDLALGSASDIRAHFAACDVNPGEIRKVVFHVASAPVCKIMDEFVVADVILSDHEGIRHRIRDVRFLRAPTR
jgi:hypothetical protein